MNQKPLIHPKQWPRITRETYLGVVASTDEIGRGRNWLVSGVAAAASNQTGSRKDYMFSFTSGVELVNPVLDAVLSDFTLTLETFERIT